ncbi:sulfatase [Pelagicoccus mobilis]|uniref:Sulfatase n=1 Tax=Pelagicoccus mobilis TaxID=415221 RepID=A0A934S407_9BACT|nr:sulfatase [Pelagicoccus mobilis]MBK1879372.1 sulfatase [Pelagicoccus mobilis]
MKKYILPLFALVLGICHADSDRPNVLFIAIDDLRPELGCYGDTIVQTPHIDRLASQGMIFERAYCQVAVCGASRASMMTGILPTDTRFVDYLAKVDEDTPNAITIGQVFKEAGYTTLAHGKIFHKGSDTAERTWSRGVKSAGRSHTTSFDPATTSALTEGGRARFFESPDVPDNAYGDGRVAENTIKNLQELAQSEEPFFLACGFIRPHLPFYAPKKYWDLYDEKEIPIADNQFRPHDAPDALRGSGEFRSYHLGDFDPDSEAFHRKMRHGYLASTSYVDQLVGNVLAELERLKLAENTIVVIWGDHGWHLGEHTFWGKHNTMHKALRIPLIVKAPGALAGERSSSLISSVDLFPTLCELAGLETPDSVQGKSFVPVLQEAEATISDVVYTRFKNADTVVTDRFTYTLYDNGEQMLYDLHKDPQENQNIANNPENKPLVRSLRDKLEAQIAFAKSARF